MAVGFRGALLAGMPEDAPVEACKGQATHVKPLQLVSSLLWLCITNLPHHAQGMSMHIQWPGENSHLSRHLGLTGHAPQLRAQPQRRLPHTAARLLEASKRGWKACLLLLPPQAREHLHLRLRLLLPPHLLGRHLPKRVKPTVLLLLRRLGGQRPSATAQAQASCSSQRSCSIIVCRVRARMHFMQCTRQIKQRPPAGFQTLWKGQRTGPLKGRWKFGLLQEQAPLRVSRKQKGPQAPASQQ